MINNMHSFKSIKTISILGSTGSIGRSTIRLIKQYPEYFKVKALTANNNVELLAEQIKELQPELAVIGDNVNLHTLKNLINGTNTKIITGKDGLIEASKIKVDIVVVAIVGAITLLPTIEAIKAGNNVAIANKECLVCAGEIIIQEAKKYKVKVIPIDSEHNAIFQILESQNCKFIDKIFLTASGGPFLKHSLSELQNVSKEQALKHPRWNMGPKITIDSATLMNKALEVIEATRLFTIDYNKVEVVIHPQSIIHGMVSFTDGSIISHATTVPDMIVPISYALFWPNRASIKQESLIDQPRNLEFFPPDIQRFPALTMAKHALQEGNYACIALNAANEIAVHNFLNDKIKFFNITNICHDILDISARKNINQIDEIIEYDNEVRILTNQLIKQKYNL